MCCLTRCRMTPIDQQHWQALTASSTQEQVITNPSLKGLELHLPPNTVIRDNDGGVVNQISITPVPAGRNTVSDAKRGVVCDVLHGAAGRSVCGGWGQPVCTRKRRADYLSEPISSASGDEV